MQKAQIMISHHSEEHQRKKVGESKTRTRKRSLFEGKTPLEIAYFLSEQLKNGLKKQDLADQIGYSPAFITKHLALLDMPPCFTDVFEKTQDVTLIWDMLKAYKKTPQRVVDFLEGKDKITRKDFIPTPQTVVQRIDIKYRNKPGHVVLDIKPRSPDTIIIILEHGRELIETPIEKVKFIRFHYLESS